MKKVDIFYFRGVYEIWVWTTPTVYERKAHRKTLEAAKNAARRYGYIDKIIIP